MSPDSRLIATAGASLLLHALVLTGVVAGHEAAPALAAFPPMTVALAGGPAPHARFRAVAEPRATAPTPHAAAADTERAPSASDAPATGVADPAPLVEARSDVASLNNPVPPYPLAARRRGLEGRVLLEVQVSAEGRCTAAHIRESSGSALLDDSALQTVRRWRFVPASRAGTPVDSRVEVPIVFRLQNTTTTAAR